MSGSLNAPSRTPADTLSGSVRFVADELARAREDLERLQITCLAMDELLDGAKAGDIALQDFDRLSQTLSGLSEFVRRLSETDAVTEASPSGANPVINPGTAHDALVMEALRNRYFGIHEENRAGPENASFGSPDVDFF